MILEAILKQLRDSMNDLADDLATGAAQSFDQYQRMVGRVEGLAISERLIKDALEKREID